MWLKKQVWGPNVNYSILLALAGKLHLAGDPVVISTRNVSASFHSVADSFVRLVVSTQRLSCLFARELQIRSGHSATKEGFGDPLPGRWLESTCGCHRVKILEFFVFEHLNLCDAWRPDDNFPVDPISEVSNLE